MPTLVIAEDAYQVVVVENSQIMLSRIPKVALVIWKTWGIAFLIRLKVRLTG